MTIIYFVRHAESVYIPHRERERGLTEKGREAANRMADLLGEADIDGMLSSPYERAIETVRPMAERRKQEIRLVEDLRERAIGEIPEDGFQSAKKRVYEDFQYAYPSGESGYQAQDRALRALLSILEEYDGKRIVIGTHGDILTLMLHAFDPSYGYDFWQASTMPDLYRATFSGRTLERVERLWGQS
ncbi:histidine phosphatase family protein [Gorillibacterium sp. sgz5001074]|uniref:histidine phosphatase family protein n=1 Tax=Gorillibacterium sp. sgz5001074 TaxID=3446695 RepID=UPI003F66E167